MSNESLNKSRSKTDNDEYYTLYEDIEKEIHHYHDQLTGKIVYCNCDDPYKSQFVRYFLRKYKEIGLKRLIATCKINGEKGYLLDVSDVPFDSDVTEEKLTFYIGFHTVQLNGDGDFQSNECKRYLEQSDVVITNPPFSLFRKWYAQVRQFKKDLVVVANFNTVLSQELHEDLVENILRFGTDTRNHGYMFTRPDGTMTSLGYICWVTTLNVPDKPFVDLIDRPLSEYRRYDNSDIVVVPRSNEIPKTDGNVRLAVPTTIMFKFNPKQFKLLGVSDFTRDKYTIVKPIIDGKRKYKYVVIQQITG